RVRDRRRAAPHRSPAPRATAVEWEGREESQNVEDRRGMGGRGLAVGGGIGGVVVLLIAAFLGINSQALTGLFGTDQSGAYKPADAEEEKLAHFTKVIFR